MLLALLAPILVPLEILVQSVPCDTVPLRQGLVFSWHMTVQVVKTFVDHCLIAQAMHTRGEGDFEGRNIGLGLLEGTVLYAEH